LLKKIARRPCRSAAVMLVHRTKTLDSAARCGRIKASLSPVSDKCGLRMAYSRVPPSGLPTFMLPCPKCGRRMRIKSVAPTSLAPELEDITHACEQCGSELVRTVKVGAFRAPAAGPPNTPQAA